MGGKTIMNNFEDRIIYENFFGKEDYVPHQQLSATVEKPVIEEKTEIISENLGNIVSTDPQIATEPVYSPVEESVMIQSNVEINSAEVAEMVPDDIINMAQVTNTEEISADTTEAAVEDAETPTNASITTSETVDTTIDVAENVVENTDLVNDIQGNTIEAASEKTPKEPECTNVVPFIRTDIVSNLVTVPAGDNNFLSALDNASIDDIKAAIEKVKDAPRATTKLKRLESRLSKLEKAEAKANTVLTDITDISEDDDEVDDITKDIEDESKNNVPVERHPIFTRDDFAEINSKEISDKEKSILYMMEHYHINPELINSMLEGNFDKAWSNISEMNKVNLTVKAKLEKEVGKASDARLKIVQYLIDKATREKDFADKILLEHKSFDRCFKYVMDKVEALYMAGHNNICLQTDDDWTYQQAVDYYNLDDYAQVMEERRQAEERKKKAEEAKKKAEEAKKKKATKKNKVGTSKVTEKKADDEKSETSVTNEVIKDANMEDSENMNLKEGEYIIDIKPNDYGKFALDLSHEKFGNVLTAVLNTKVEAYAVAKQTISDIKSGKSHIGELTSKNTSSVEPENIDKELNNNKDESSAPVEGPSAVTDIAEETQIVSTPPVIETSNNESFNNVQVTDAISNASDDVVNFDMLFNEFGQMTMF